MPTKIFWSPQNFIRCATEYNSDVISGLHLGNKKLFNLLAIPSDEREDFISKSHEVNGQTKTVDEMTTRNKKGQPVKYNKAILNSTMTI